MMMMMMLMIIIVNVLVNNDEQTTAHHIDLPMNVIRRNSFFKPTLSRQHQQQQLQRPGG